ncbi:MAG: galactokinase [Spirochaetales bacterium]|nr:MAG: galactokinase [Spirochaetales bacterium]
MDITQLHRIEYEASPDVVTSAPGVVRLIGEHTIGSNGVYLGLPFNRSVSVAMSSRRDSSLRFFAADANERKRTNLGNLKYKREDRWANYVKGALSVYFGERTGSRGYNVTVSGDVPQGLGLGSSNALLCASVRAAAILAGASIEPHELESAAVEVAKSYFDKDIKNAEYAAALRAHAGHFVLVDANDGSCRQIPVTLSDYTVLLTDSRVPRPPVDIELKARTEDCSRGLAMLGGGTRGLRSYSTDDLDEFMGVMPEHVRRHCTFFMEEVDRTMEAGDALARGDLLGFSRIFNKSQASLRNNYEVSCPEIDWLVKRSLEIDGVLASRMVGKGFGGCTITFLAEIALIEYRKRLEEYERIFGFRPIVWEIDPWEGLPADVLDDR